MKHLLPTPLATAPDQEIVYRDRSRYTYRTLYQRIGQLARGLARPPPAQKAGDRTSLRIVGEQQKELRRVRNGVLEATEQVTVPHSSLGLLWYYTKRS